jgi:hypothetical protein
MRTLIAAALLAVLAGGSSADDKGTPVEWAGLKSTTPAGWKKETPMDKLGLRVGQFKLPKAEGEAEAELALFITKGGGSTEANLERQVKKFELEKDAKPAVSKMKIGTYDAVYQDISGTLLKKFPPFDPNAKITRVEKQRQIYVIFEGKEDVYSLTLLGSAKTIEKNKKDFDEWLKNFK